MNGYEQLKKAAKAASIRLQNLGYEQVKSADDIIKLMTEAESKGLSLLDRMKFTKLLSTIIAYYAEETTDLDIYWDEYNLSPILSDDKKFLNIYPTLLWAMSMDVGAQFLRYGDLAKLRRPKLLYDDISYLKRLQIPLVDGTTIRGEDILEPFGDRINYFFKNLLSAKTLSIMDDLFSFASVFAASKPSNIKISEMLTEHPNSNHNVAILTELVALYMWLKDGFVFKSFSRNNGFIDNCEMQFGDQDIDVVKYVQNHVLFYFKNNAKFMDNVSMIYVMANQPGWIMNGLMNSRDRGTPWNAIRNRRYNWKMKNSDYLFDEEYQDISGIYPDDKNDIDMAEKPILDNRYFN